MNNDNLRAAIIDAGVAMAEYAKQNPGHDKAPAALRAALDALECTTDKTGPIMGAMNELLAQVANICSAPPAGPVS